MKIIFILIAVLMTSCSANTFSLLHYNVKELRTKKLQDPSNKQVNSLIEFLNKEKFDILSINEIQYEKSNLQSLNQKLTGKKLENEVFIKANTGNNATTGKPDLVNFGTLPGEYSTGALTKYKTQRQVIVRDLKWKNFFATDNLDNFALSNAKPIPESIELFDKSFSDTTLSIHGKDVHLILLHTVPAFGFGNNKTVNFFRNQRQLEFLRWYLNLDGNSQKVAGIQPLKKNDYFIVVGDLNVDFKASAPGSKVLASIISDGNPWISTDKMDYTHPSPKLMLDYIITSKNIKALKGKIFKSAGPLISDHLPIWGKFEIL